MRILWINNDGGGFADYVDLVTGTFHKYKTDILAMIEEGPRVSGKMRFHGYHRKELFGVSPSGRHVWWIGMPIFTFIMTSILARGLRFFIVAGLLWKFGEPIRAFIEKYLGLLFTLFVILLIGGFYVLRFL